ncbi:MAG: FtsX-like permease family protein [Aigarchaeota archaeon]|nr:FtsX-like permease family protein [Candidatus Pelearchaeum maunauluense]
MIGYDLAKEIAEELRSADNVESALRRRIELNIVSEDGSETRRYTVVGILKDLPMLSSVILLSIDGNYDIKRQVPGKGVDMVYHVIEVRVNSVSQITQVKDAVLAYPNDRSDAVRFLKRDAPKLEFVIISLEDLTNFVKEQIDMFANFVTMIGSISLLVGSIGISNIMLVNVTERTREIGVLRALGAKRSVILQLFLVESVLIGVVGALLGVALGMVLGLVFIRLGLLAALNAPFVVVLDWIPIAVGVGAAVGVVSGIYPAWRAGRTVPVHSLRHE